MHKNPPYVHIKIILFIMLGDPNNLKSTAYGAVYGRYTWDDAVYAAASGPRLYNQKGVS